MGNLFVGEQPLAESPMKDHPLTPMRDSNLMRLLTPQVKRPVGLANRHAVARGAGALSARLEELRAQGVAHVVVDAVSNDDLTVIATAQKLHARYYPVFKDLFIETNPVPAKAALAMMGLLHEEYRLPLCPMSEANRATLRATLKKCGVLR